MCTFEPYILVLLVYGYILGLRYMETNQIGNHGLIHFCCMFYNDSFYEFIAMFFTEEKKQKNGTSRNINDNNGFLFIYSSLLLDKLIALKVILQSIISLSQRKARLNSESR